MNTLNSIRDIMVKEFLAKGFSIHRWPAGRSSNILEIDTKPNPTALYLKVSNSLPGFWGLTRNQIQRLEKTRIKWFAVLFTGSPYKGYILSSDEVKLRIQDGSFELSDDGDYKVNERTDLNALMVFRSIIELIERVL